MGGSLEEQDVETGSLTAAELRLNRVLIIFSIAFAAMAGGYVYQGVAGDAEFPFVANSLAKDGLFSILCLIAASDIRRFVGAVRLVIGGHILIIIGLLIMGATGDNDSVAGSFEGIDWLPTPDPHQVWAIWLVLAIAVTVVLLRLTGAAVRSRYQLRYLSQAQHRTVTALAEVIVEPAGGDVELLTPLQVARNVDEYLHDLDSVGKKKISYALTAATYYPLLRLRPPLPIMSVANRKAFVERCFLADVVERRLPGPIRKVVQSIFVGCQQVVYIGYWADPRTHSAAGYVPFSERPRYKEAMATRVAHERPTVRSRRPRDVDGLEHRADVVVIGSGAGGATMANRLAAAGRKVTLLERGRHIEPKNFSEDERKQFSDLYHDGAVQMSTDARFQVLQGQCVGGTTVVNNAVCFDLPENTFKRWNASDGLNAGLDKDRLYEAFAKLNQQLPVQSQATTPLQQGGVKFDQGVKLLGYNEKPNEYGVVDANIVGCLGCGYCNYGCAYGKKLSMLDGMIPDAQLKYGEDNLEVIAECDVQKIETDGNQATGVKCKLRDGRELRVHANAVVVSAGALASSTLLQRSKIGGKLPGSCLSFNMGAPMTAEFDEVLDSYDGLQITHSLQPAGEPGLILETWFNPVGAQALFMPGWFSDHWRNMRNYNRMACVGSVVGTRSNARVRNGGFMQPGLRLDYTPHPDDLSQLIRGLVLAGKIMLKAGATRVMPSTFRSLAFTSAEQLDDLDNYIRDDTDITLHSSHPQGGNPVSADPAKGVVGPDFRVHGYGNLHVVDASVFPSSITVNPQLTVMALADVAADALIA